ncbi:MAG: two-component regulator propeller domain-containing protein [Verrucomicrobiota bacterium]
MPRTEFQVTVWKPDDGVPRDFVTSFAQDADGYLWMISDQALARFDGVRFVDLQTERFIPGAPERPGPWRFSDRLFSGTSGSVWLTTSSGDVWRWHHRQFELWIPPNPPSRAFLHVGEISPDEIVALSRQGTLLRATRFETREIARLAHYGRPLSDSVCQDTEGNVWLLTDRSVLLRVDIDGGITLPLSHTEHEAHVQTVAADAFGKIWLGTTQGLFCWYGDHFERLQTPGEAGAPFSVQAILPAPDGSLWVASSNKAWFWKSGEWSTPMHEWPDNVPGHARLVDRQNRLWLAPPRQGLWCFEPTGHSQQLGPEQGLVADAMALFCDREGNVWASIYRTGIARLRPRRFTPVTVTAGLHTTPLWNVGEDSSGAMWFSPELKGPVRWRDDCEDEFSFPGSQPDPFRWTKALGIDRKGGVWAALLGFGVLQFDGTAFKKALPWPRGAGFSRVLFQDKSERWWMGSDFGLVSWSGDRWHEWGSENGFPKLPTRAITEDCKGNLWFGTLGGGIARLDGEQFTRFTQKDGLAHDSVYALFGGADGSVWVGTQGGLARWRYGHFSTYTMADGLPDNRVVQVLEDGLGYLWLGTRNGLCRISLRSINAKDRGATRRLETLVFDQHDGLPTRVFQDRCSPACWRAKDGRLWFLTAGAAVYCRPQELQINDVAPAAIIEELIIDGQPWQAAGRASEKPFPVEMKALSALSIQAPDRIELPPGPHLVEIHYTAPSLTVPEKVRFEYQLAGVDSTWIQAGSRRSALYSSLPPGEHRFRVRSANNDGKWNESCAEFALVIQPYFWQTRWFPGLITLLVGLGAGGGVALLQHLQVRRRLARLELQRAREAERTRISRDLHDHLGASLTEIGMLAADGADTAPVAKSVAKQFQTINEKVQTIVNELDAMVWAVDPRQDTLLSLAGYLASFVEEFTAAANINCRVDVPRDLPEWPLCSEARHSLFLAVKEAVNNAVRHGCATEICFRMRLEARDLEICVQDNGAGFDPERLTPGQSGGNGLSNLQTRLASLGGRCEIQSQPGAGTTVLLRFSLPDLN